MEKVLRGEIYLAKFNKKSTESNGEQQSSVQHGFRPILIVQNNRGNENSPTVIVAPMTSKLDKPALPTHVTASTEYGLHMTSIILMEHLTTIDRFRLVQKIGALDEEKMKEVNNALAISVGLKDE